MRYVKNWLTFLACLYLIFRVVVYFMNAKPSDYGGLLMLGWLVLQVVLPILGFIGLCFLVVGVSRKLFS
jgi:hypothetical protein